MARKKSGRKKKGGGRSTRWRLALLLVAALAAALALVLLRPGARAPRKPPPPPAVSQQKPPKGRPVPAPPMQRPAATPGPEAPGPEARVSIIIDDMGFKDKPCVDLINLDLNLSFAFLPFGPHTAAQLALAHAKSRDILVHVPMEPQDHHWSLGPGALLTSMNTHEIQLTLARDIAAIPYAVGVNNHMGSRFTEERAPMQACLELLRQRQLFFIDSVTSAHSLGYTLAREMGVASARRDIFIDNSEEPQSIQVQLEALFARARQRGAAIGIGHPHEATLQVLRQYQSTWPRDIRLVAVSQLARQPE